ncbi:hypothetical protein A5722_05160 [Mycobacterium vulneris]|nr:hypothetical protein A5721_07045 [Mycolicibacterium vulneris]OCB59144.1 hypothetical protein A5722_05160 [Mycolicibacterium vulneris]OCB61506.1 hypothetical protein A5729_03835 [Mycolicibacterium vulneris]
MVEQKKIRPGAQRPELEDFDAVVEAIYAVGDDVRLLIQAITKTDIGLHPRPQGPLEIIAANRAQINLDKIAELTA